MRELLIDGAGQLIDLPELVWEVSVLPLARRLERPVQIGRWWAMPDGSRIPVISGGASVKSAYGTSNQAITCTITSLASSTSGAGRSSTAVNNTSNLWLDALVFAAVKTSSSALANDKAVYVYAYGTADGGTTYTDGITGSDANFTATVGTGQYPMALRPLLTISTPSSSTTYDAGPVSVAQAFGGVLPDHWGVFVLNITGQNLDASVGSVWYQGIYSTVA